MPMVQITMLEGRTADQKRKIAKRITDALSGRSGSPARRYYRCIPRSIRGELRFGWRVNGG